MTFRSLAPLVRMPFAVCVAASLMTAGCMGSASVRPAAAHLHHQVPGGGQIPAVGWIARRDAAERLSLDAWSLGVGPAVYLPGPRSRTPQVHEPIALVSWNVNVGAGDLDSFVRDLRSGRFSDGRPIEHFVLLIQEALRGGPAVPPTAPGQAGARRLVRSPHPIDVVRYARSAQLSLFYVPSMRNGSSPGGPDEDRGNAILSTQPLSNLRALELPFVRQRRVVPVATIRGGGAEHLITVASVHLDPFVGLRRLWLIGAARMRGWQASVVASNLSAAGALVVGGDFNTWRGPDEPAFSEMQRISDPAPWPAQPTFAGGGVLDHLFFRLPAGWQGGYRRAPQSYGSDHFPVVGWIHARPDPAPTE